MNVMVKVSKTVAARAGVQLLSNNIEAYENTIPSMLSDRLRNSKFSGPENPQTGLAAEWEPVHHGMQGLICRLVPGMYLSGRESQLVQGYTEDRPHAIVQAGVPVREGESFEVEMWARSQHRPVEVEVQLRKLGQATPTECRATLLVDQAHWCRRICQIASPGDGEAHFHISIPGDSRLLIDQVHLRPVGHGHVSPALDELFKRVPCPVLRFPGGGVSCNYHWEHGVGPVHLRPICDDPTFKFKMHYDFGTDEYLELCAAKDIRPFITLNTTSATPDDAAGWARYVRDWYIARGLQVPAAYFMVGNENYGTWEIGHMTGEMYVLQLREFVPRVRDAYPEARIVAIGELESGGVRTQYKTPWRDLVVEQAADLFDVLAVTSYSGGSDNVSMPDRMAKVADGVAKKTEHLIGLAQTLRDAKLDRTIGIAEWNYFTRASHYDRAGFYEPNDIRHCLYAAGYLNAFFRCGDAMEFASYYSLINTMGMAQVHNDEVTLSDVVKVFGLYADALPGEVFDLSIDAPPLTETSPAVDALSVGTNGGVYVFLVNYSATESATVAIDAADDRPIEEARGLRGYEILEPVEELQPTVNGSSVEVPPMSLVRVKMG